MQLNGRELLLHAVGVSQQLALDESSDADQKYKQVVTANEKEQILKEIEEGLKKLKK